MGKKTTSGDHFKIAAGVLGLVILFAGAAAAFYINRDYIYSFLRGTAGETAETGANKEHIPAQIPLGQSYAPNPEGHFEPSEPPEVFEPSDISGQFKNIIFLGDSIISGFEFCKDTTEINGEKVFKETTVVAAVGYSLKNAVSEISKNSVNLNHERKAMRPEDIIALMDNEYVFVCLGLNDLFGTPLDEYIENYGRLVKNIREKSPGKTIAVLSVTPLVSGQAWGLMTNKVIAEANDRLMEFAGDNDLYFIDWATAIRDEYGALHKNLSSDGFCHLKPEAYKLLAGYLADVIRR
jgi:lysophospholipase L1-like esterase